MTETTFPFLRRLPRWIAAGLCFACGAGAAHAQTVKLTPLGQTAGELAAFDRAVLFEDPTGVRILYDPGPTVSAGDPRLGAVHVILVSHGHGDHLGSTPQIAAAKNAAVVAAPDLASFIGKKIQAITGAPTPACPPPPINATGVGSNGMTVPRPTACTALLGISGARTISNGGPAIEIATVPANHDSSAAAATLSEPLKTELTADGLTAYLDPANGFVVKFTNGLSVYLTGDTGLTAEMDTIIREFYRPSLMIINIGDLFTTGPEAAAFAATRLVRPRAVIPSHVNEAATTAGVVNPGSRTARFIAAVERIGRGDDRGDEGRGRIVVHVPKSGITMEFDARGSCVSGCS
ncbi:MAG: metal-dependent hydrolase [Acidobacteria bacterium]|nr:MAG: metal-dependent hydrolase [Acidobacteriota bacterium]